MVIFVLVLSTFSHQNLGIGKPELIFVLLQQTMATVSPIDWRWSHGDGTQCNRERAHSNCFVIFANFANVSLLCLKGLIKICNIMTQLAMAGCVESISVIISITHRASACI